MYLVLDPLERVGAEVTLDAFLAPPALAPFAVTAQQVPAVPAPRANRIVIRGAGSAPCVVIGAQAADGDGDLPVLVDTEAEVAEGYDTARVRLPAFASAVGSGSHSVELNRANRARQLDAALPPARLLDGLLVHDEGSGNRRWVLPYYSHRICGEPLRNSHRVRDNNVQKLNSS